MQTGKKRCVSKTPEQIEEEKKRNKKMAAEKIAEKRSRIIEEIKLKSTIPLTTKEAELAVDFLAAINAEEEEKFRQKNFGENFNRLIYALADAGFINSYAGERELRLNYRNLIKI